LLPTDAGTVASGGRGLTTSERSSVLFYMPDGIAPWASQTVGWILDFAIGFFGGDGKRRGEVVEALDLEPLLSQSMGTLSKGQRKRVLLAIGLLTPQPVLLCDEPFDGLDLRQSRDVAMALCAHASAGRTLLLSIHQIADAARVCDRFVLLSGGRVRGEGSLEELASLAAMRGAAPARQNDLEEVFLALT
jgi:ABC-2 type transport system ATP-binding protein